MQCLSATLFDLFDHFWGLSDHAAIYFAPLGIWYLLTVWDRAKKELTWAFEQRIVEI